MLNACLHNPVMLAREVVTLVQLSGGRMELGLGAGHTPGEFAACGVPMEPALERKARLTEFVEIMRALLDGRTVEHHSDRYDLHGAATASPAAQERLPILVGGSGERLLTHAGSHADIIGFTGLGRRLADGHHHAVRFGTDVLDGETAFVRAGGARTGSKPSSTCSCKWSTSPTTVCGRRRGWVQDVEGLTRNDAMQTPFLALGTVDEIADQLVAGRARWGITYFVVRSAEPFAPVIARLRSS